MKDKSWTSEQNRAITSTGKPVLISAAAGSGKTAVLVERAVRLITDAVNPVPADKIVLVTFTRKAAAEMRERLKKRIEEIILSDGHFGEKLLQDQLIRLEDAQITTINAFCLSLLKDNSGFAGLEPGFSVASEDELEILAKDAMGDALEEFYEGEQSEITRVMNFFGGNSDMGLRRAVRELYGFTRNLPEPDLWVEQQGELYKNPDRYFNKVIRGFSDLLKKDIGRAVSLIEESLSIAEFDKTEKFLREESAFFQKYMKTDFSDLSAVADLALTAYPRKSVDKNEDALVKEVISQNRKKTDALHKELALAGELIVEFKKSVAGLEPIIGSVIRLYWLFERNYTLRKRGKKVVDFADCEHMCLELLQDNPVAAERLREDYELIIVDEFQDSNFLQYKIFELLDGGRGGLFLVGDIKQSIYKFRGADPDVFSAVSENAEYEIIHLSNNFRSCRETVNGINDVFKVCMSREVGGVDYDQNAMLKDGKGVCGGEVHKAELVIVGEGGFPGHDGLSAEARYTALRIKAMVDEGFAVFDKDGSLRRCDYGDFAVLTSAGDKNFRVYKKVLEEQGVPCASENPGDYLKAEEIGLALDLLTVIDNPYNDLSLLNILMSPIYGFSAEDLAGLRADKKNAPLYSAVLAAKNDKAAVFLNSLARFRRIADTCDVVELICSINAEGWFLPLVADRQRRANIRLLSYYAQDYAGRNADGSLSGFLAYIKDLKKLGADVKQASSDAGAKGRVRLSTIHGAKGLEFPVCFVGRVNQEFNFRWGGTSALGSALVKFNKDAGIVAHLYDEKSNCRFKTLHWNYAERLNRVDTVSEEMRKLYVAATRAESKLIFTGYTKDALSTEHVGELAVSGSSVKDNSYADWLVKSGDGVVKSAYGGEVTEVDISGVAAVQPVNHEKGIAVGSTVSGGLELSFAEKDGAVTVIAANIAAEYPKRLLFDIPRKLSATQAGVVREVYGDEDDEPAVFPRNPSFYGEKRLTGKKRGDAYHKAMELIDFAKGDYTGQIKELKAHFTPIEYKAVNLGDIEGFFLSKLGRRAVDSGSVVKEYKLYTEIALSAVAGGGVSDEMSDEKPFIQGIADMFFYEGGDIVLVDYKTNRNTTPERLAKEYGGQLLIYKKAIEEMTGCRVKECWLYSFEWGEVRVEV